MSILDNNQSTILSTGLSTNNTNEESTSVTYALNAIRNNSEGGIPSYQNEPGNTFKAALPESYVLIGSIYGKDNKTYLFASNASTNASLIGVYENGAFTSLATPDLGFNVLNPITGEYRVKNGCDEILYWCDALNNDYYFIVNKPELFKTGGTFDPNKFKVKQSIPIPNIDLVKVNDTGGNLPLGSYYFQLEYVNKSGDSIWKSDITPQTIVYDDSQSSGYENIDGGLNYPDFTQEIGGLQPTTKSIQLLLSDLDISQQYFKINVIRQITSNEVVSCHTTPIQPITGDSQTWIYTGYKPTQGDLIVSYPDLLIGNANYKSSYVMEQVEGRLIKANVVEETVDYSGYQAFASKIKVECQTEDIETKNAFALGNCKNPSTYWYKTGFQSDEVYALGIQYLNEDDFRWSPAFHIPGREATLSDTQSLSVIANNLIPGINEIRLQEVEHLGISLGGSIERWRVQSTHTLVADALYTMGYYESDNATYQDIKDCNEELIWGETFDGNPITTSTKIRHHKFPDRKNLFIADSTGALETAKHFGLKFSNVEYPAGVIAHRFLYVKRDEFNKTVVDSGYFGKAPDNINLNFVPDGQPITSGVGLLIENNNASIGSTSLYNSYVSPKTTFENKILQATYLKVEHEARGTDGVTYVDVYDIDDPSSTINVPNAYWFETTPSTFTGSNFKVLGQIKVGAFSYQQPTQVFTVPIKNFNSAKSANVIKTNDSIPASTFVASTAPILYGHKKVIAQPFDNLNVLQYNYLNYNPIYNTASSIIFNGDTLISQLTVVFYDNHDGLMDDRLSAGSGTTFSFLFCESQINSELRHSGTTDVNLYTQEGIIKTFLRRKLETLLDNGKYQHKEPYLDFYYSNYDYNINYKANVILPLPFNYEYCTDCQGKYKNRIIFSPKSFDEDTFDLYKINKINDYIDIPNNRGQITGIKYKNGQLLVHTEETTFIVKPSPQYLSSNEATIYLTTGDFFTIPPQELIITDTGYAGMQNKINCTNNQYGYQWIDQKRGQVFNFTNNIEELSLKDMTMFLKTELPSYMLKEFKRVTGSDYPFASSPYHKSGIGVLVWFDPHFKRLLIKKQDFKPIGQTKLVPTSFPATYFNTSLNRWEYYTTSIGNVAFPETTVLGFENKSWTLSYSFEYGTWTSFHSYMPRFVFSDDISYYTSRGGDVYEHNKKDNFQTFFGSKKDFIVEWLNYNPQTRNFNGLQWQAYADIWDATKEVYNLTSVTFDRLWCYTEDQSTGIQTLTLANQHTLPYANISSTGSSKFVVQTDNNYKVSDIKDMLTASPSTSKLWSSIQPSFPIDKVPVNINYTKSPYICGNINNKGLYTRLYFKPVTDVRKIINIIQSNSHLSIR